MTYRALLLASAVALAAPAAAQVILDASADRQEEIIVTARQSEERLQDVPIAISVVRPEDIRRQGMFSLRDVASVVPGYAFETLQPLVPQTVIRGQTNLRVDSPVTNVAYFVDGVYLQRPFLVDQRLLEIARFEVVKGPQSALYGRNAFAGAVSIATVAPDLAEIQGRVGGTIGNHGRHEGRGFVSVPILRDRLAVLVAGAWSDFDGTWPNAHPLADAEGANSRGKLGGFRNWMVQGRITARLAETLRLEASYIRTERDEEALPSYTVGTQTLLYPFNTLNASPRPGLTPPFTVQNRLWVGPFPSTPVVAPQDTLRPPGVVIDPRAFGLRGPTEFATAKLAWSPDAPVSVDYLFGYAWGEVLGRGSPSPNPLRPVLVPFPPFNLGTIFDESGTDSAFRGTSHDLRFVFRGNERWNGFIGFHHSRTKDIASNATSNAPVNSLVEPDPAVYLFPIGPGLPFPNNLFQRNTYLERRERIHALYYFAEVRPLERLAVTFEGRLSIEDQDATDFLTREPTNPAVQAFRPPTFRQSITYFAPRVTATYRLSPDHMVYASAARGVKAGGINGNLPFVPQRTYDSETNWTYEIGTKNRFGPFTANLAAYYTDWRDLQTTVVRLNADGTAPSFFAIVPSTIGNVDGGARIWGLEAELAWAPTDALRFYANAAYSNSRYKDGTTSQRFGASGNCDGVVCRTIPGTPTPVLPIGGNRLERVPLYDAAVGGRYDLKLANGLGLFASLEGTFKSSQFMDEANLSSVPFRALMNGTIGADFRGFELTFWARNILDKEYVTSALFLIGTNGALSASYVPTFGERRTLGLTGAFRF
ncbi:MAG: TonB-dependent receptor [Sphingomonadaceae bacterium]|uniref:TonB-dependent receptor n=1 Tax=Thermaurantiacus sp. TaxID=2820283 RepID=UPI00298F360A|nr:TonB-dependent receptor [Thermaurantiacus sp.]MCS6987574.1 TonB-dependent receptor [Sphingomonadaceae bacterium]MDW8415175.1 TonB-dependent receptor [Thermaurantiacus sp.]